MSRRRTRRDRTGLRSVTPMSNPLTRLARRPTVVERPTNSEGKHVVTWRGGMYARRVFAVAGGCVVDPNSGDCQAVGPGSAVSSGVDYAGFRILQDQGAADLCGQA